MNKIEKEYIGNYSSGEIDFELYDELYGKDKWKNDDLDNHPGDFNEKNIQLAPWAGESYPMNIDELIYIFQKWKQSGATHAEIMYHYDHIGYEISFLKFNK